MPSHGGRIIAVALEAKVFSGFLADLPVWVVACRTVETVGPADLVRAGNFLEFTHIAMAPVANARRDGAQVL